MAIFSALLVDVADAPRDDGAIVAKTIVVAFVATADGHEWCGRSDGVKRCRVHCLPRLEIDNGDLVRIDFAEIAIVRIPEVGCDGRIQPHQIGSDGIDVYLVATDEGPAERLIVAFVETGTITADQSIDDAQAGNS